VRQKHNGRISSFIFRTGGFRRFAIKVMIDVVLNWWTFVQGKKFKKYSGHKLM